MREQRNETSQEQVESHLQASLITPIQSIQAAPTAIRQFI